MNEGYRRCCGMDIHKDTVVVCVLPPAGADGQAVRKVYGTFRNDLIRMRVWLKQLRVTEIAMESTGVYWRPIWNVLEEEGFRLLLVNPAQVKALAGRKAMDATPAGLPNICRTEGWTGVSFLQPKRGSYA
jgi:transposase